MQRVTLLRHGRSRADDEGRFEGRYDSPLTEVGIDQAQRLARAWAGRNDRQYDLLIASPLGRAAETAAILGKTLGLKPEPIDLWMERDNGGLAGLTFEEGASAYPKPEFTGRYDRMARASGESSAGLHARAMAALEDLMQRSFDAALVVAHGGVLQAVVRCALGIAPSGETGGFGIHFRDLTHLDLAWDRRADRWHLVELVHLEPA